jgi:7,8-dihydroneopterin aldolase/epimerase/oxygenase
MERKVKTVFIFAIKMGRIYLKNIRLYAFHGCMDEEGKIGSDYVVNVFVDTDLSHSSLSDDLKDTVDYVALHTIVKKEMSIRAKLLEKVADRILKRILKEHPEVVLVNVKVAKKNPPIGGNVEEVAVERELNRSSAEFD